MKVHDVIQHYLLARQCGLPHTQNVSDSNPGRRHFLVKGGAHLSAKPARQGYWNKQKLLLRSCWVLPHSVWLFQADNLYLKVHSNQYHYKIPDCYAAWKGHHIIVKVQNWILVSVPSDLFKPSQPTFQRTSVNMILLRYIPRMVTLTTFNKQNYVYISWSPTSAIYYSYFSPVILI